MLFWWLYSRCARTAKSAGLSSMHGACGSVGAAGGGSAWGLAFTATARRFKRWFLRWKQRLRRPLMGIQISCRSFWMSQSVLALACSWVTSSSVRVMLTTLATPPPCSTHGRLRYTSSLIPYIPCVTNNDNTTTGNNQLWSRSLNWCHCWQKPKRGFRHGSRAGLPSGLITFVRAGCLLKIAEN